MEEKQVFELVTRIYGPLPSSLEPIRTAFGDGHEKWQELVVSLKDAGLRVLDDDYLDPMRSGARTLAIALYDDPYNQSRLVFHLSSLAPLYIYYFNESPHITREDEKSFLERHREALKKIDPIERPKAIKELLSVEYNVAFKESLFEAYNELSQAILAKLLKAVAQIYPNYILFNKALLFKPVPELKNDPLPAPTYFDLLFDETRRYLMQR
ncbi:hypothetical protein [Deminuibacter soli]|uniref:Uncharacterized protein n=1 Tax=Deminuibacter soli TaxID=2291815 RepID=A0A3E1NCY7_9BACT|nr:hypothetical protein [Deminuibacter soli]RFM25638.1 hypothetical protein DXN05_24190 [Deminuibacter soli]